MNKNLPWFNIFVYRYAAAHRFVFHQRVRSPWGFPFECARVSERITTLRGFFGFAWKKHHQLWPAVFPRSSAFLDTRSSFMQTTRRASGLYTGWDTIVNKQSIVSHYPLTVVRETQLDIFGAVLNHWRSKWITLTVINRQREHWLRCNSDVMCIDNPVIRPLSLIVNTVCLHFRVNSADSRAHKALFIVKKMPVRLLFSAIIQNAI